MKKRWLLVLLVGVVVGTALVMSRGDEVATVTTATLTAERVEQTVICNGVVETAKTTGVVLPIPCVVETVCVKAGSRVQKGDVLFVVDKQATLSVGDVAVRVPLAAMDDEVIAPEDGVVIEVNVRAGTTTETGIPCVILALEQDVQVRLGLREKDLQVIREGMAVQLSGEGFSQSTYTGTLTEISAAARADTGSGVVVEGVVMLDEGQADESLRLGLSARAKVVTAVEEAGVLVPHEAVLSDESGSYVYLVKQGCAQREYITVSGQVAAGILLTDRSLEGQTVICNPGAVKYDGMPVKEATP